MPVSSDEKLCEKMKCKDIGEIRAEITKALQSEKKQEARVGMKKDIFDKIEKDIPEFPMPPSMLNAEIEK